MNNERRVGTLYSPRLRISVPPRLRVPRSLHPLRASVPPRETKIRIPSVPLCATDSCILRASVPPRETTFRVSDEN